MQLPDSPPASAQGGIPVLKTSVEHSLSDKLDMSEECNECTISILNGKELRRLYDQTCADDVDAYTITGSQYFGKLYCHGRVRPYGADESRYCCSRTMNSLGGVAVTGCLNESRSMCESVIVSDDAAESREKRRKC